MGLLYGEKCTILTTTVLHESPVWQTDGQTDRIAIAYARLAYMAYMLSRAKTRNFLVLFLFLLSYRVSIFVLRIFFSEFWTVSYHSKYRRKLPHRQTFSSSILLLVFSDGRRSVAQHAGQSTRPCPVELPRALITLYLVSAALVPSPPAAETDEEDANDDAIQYTRAWRVHARHGGRVSFRWNGSGWRRPS